MSHFIFATVAAYLAFTFAASAQTVVINEVSSVQSDRRLQYPAGALPKLGATPRWQDLDFQKPTWWQSGAGPFGFGYTQTTNVQAEVRGKTPVVYLRREFTLSAAQAASGLPLELLIDYDDGFVAYLNGQEIARRNLGATGSFAWHYQEAFNLKTATGAEAIPLGIGSTRLRVGLNVLAIQVHNSETADGQLRCDATLRLNGGATLVASGDLWSWFAGTHKPAGGVYDGTDFAFALPLGPDWTQNSYADSAWTLGNGAIGYDTAAAGTEYRPQLGTNLVAQMLNVAWSVYLRREFTLTQAQFDALTATSLTVDWDDGYVLYLNGYELSRANLAGNPGAFVPFNSAASGHGAQFESNLNNPAAVASIPVAKNLLRVGRNVISGQLHNTSLGSSDLLLDVRFSGTSAGATLSWVTLGSPWRYKVATSEFATPAPAVSALLAPEFLDWIELKNTGAATADIGGWLLTDELNEPAKWAFPNGTTIPAGGYLVVACSGRNVVAPPTGGLLHTNFSLKEKGEYLGLRNAGGVVQSELPEVPDQDAFHSWGLDAGSGQYRYLDAATPGAANTAGTATELATEVNFSHATGFYASPPAVALSTQTTGAAIRYTLDGSDPTSASTLFTAPFDPTGRPAIGPGAGTILREMFQWSTGTVVPPASLPAGATPTTSQLMTQLETPSNISDYYTHRVRGFLHPAQSGNYQFWLATDDDGELWLSTTEQPANKVRIANIAGWSGIREWTKYASQQSVVIPLVAGQRYYLEALQSEGGGGDNLAVGWSGPGLPAGVNVIEGRYLSPPAALPPGTTSPAGYGTVRARAFLAGRLPSEVRTRNYVTGLDPRLTTVPAFFLSGPASETFYNDNGVFAQVGGNFTTGSWQPNDARFDYNFCLSSGDAFERPATLEIVNPGNQIVERTNVGVRFAGSPWSRPQYQLQNAATSQWNSGAHNKPQVNLFFRGDFGISTLKVDGFIPTSPLKEWDTLRLRAGKNDPYNPFIIDEWMRQTLAATGAPSPQGFIATLFINGQFKSYFNPCERPRGSFFQEFYGSGNPWDVNYIGSWEEGDGTAYAQMETFFRNNDFTALAKYQTGAAFWDMANVADYIIVNGWGATQDWPGNNYTFARERAPGALWRWSMWDAEGALGVFGQPNTHNTFENELHVSSAVAGIGSEGTTAALVFRRAQQNAEFRLLFADRLQKHFFNGGCMTRTNLDARWNALRAKVEPLIGAVFGGGFYNGHWDNWAGRDATFLAQARAANLWPVTAAPGLTPFGGAAASVALSNPNGSGAIYYTMNGNDPRAVGGTIQGSVYSGAIAVTAPFILKARVLNAGEWSPLVEADFAPAIIPRIVINEINYNPAGPDDLTEFVELLNAGNTAASLNGAQFTDGIGFTFGNVTLAPGQTLVLVKNAAAFTNAYPSVPVAGVFSGALDNSGETLTLRDLAGQLIFSVDYGDSNIAGWPAGADGAGATLVLRRPFSPTTNAALAANWRASGTPGGNPGAADSTVFAGNPNADLDRDGFSALTEYALGTSDTASAARPQFEFSRDASDHLIVTFLHPEAADDVIIEGLESTTLSAWTNAGLQSDAPASPGWLRATWKSSASGPQVFLRVRVRWE